MLTVEQVKQLLVDVYNEKARASSWRDELFDTDDLDWNEISEMFEWTDETFSAHGVTIERADFDTGREGHAEDIHMVFKTTDRQGNEQYWRKTGYYASYDGDNWDGDFREVRPVERLVTFYE